MNNMDDSIKHENEFYFIDVERNSIEFKVQQI